ncbi:MAG: 6,7-dimethyl-8-ribityllumazine synthase [Deltaproteobacteria bacterium]|nr:6,7-dimethyl-8-ribityllumazine synthase [Deltaproteobacteria bacterium]
MKIIDGKESKTQFNISVIVSRFNSEVTKLLLQGALERLKELGFSENQTTVVWVPGAIEIPLAAQRVAQLGLHEAILCLGAVIRGETDHYKYVAEQASIGCQQVALQNDIPVVFAVLTTENEEQALARAGGKQGNKGREAVDTAVEIVSVLRLIG